MQSIRPWHSFHRLEIDLQENDDWQCPWWASLQTNWAEQRERTKNAWSSRHYILFQDGNLDDSARLILRSLRIIENVEREPSVCKKCTLGCILTFQADCRNDEECDMGWQHVKWREYSICWSFVVRKSGTILAEITLSSILRWWADFQIKMS